VKRETMERVETKELFAFCFVFLGRKRCARVGMAYLLKHIR
jgi:hypothetical protein